MTQQEKQLLINDLCARLPYGVKCRIDYGKPKPGAYCPEDYERFADDTIICAYPKTYEFGMYIDDGLYSVEQIKPYLRPMSSMTEEEKEDLKKEHLKDEKLYAECLTNAANGDSSMRGKVIPHFAADWCNKNYFDYRGLIPTLALEAKEGMYK